MLIPKKKRFVSLRIVQHTHTQAGKMIILVGAKSDGRLIVPIILKLSLVSRFGATMVMLA